MAEWLYEDGIGEARAALIESGRIVEALIEPANNRLRAGHVGDARLTEIGPGKRWALATIDGEEVRIEPAPATAQGGLFRVEVVREALPEPGNPKRAKARAVDPATPLRPGATLFERLTGARTLGSHDADAFEAAGWGETLEATATGLLAFPGGSLTLSPTPAMTLIDVDGDAPPDELAVTGAEAAARAIRLFGIGGSIGIDLPTVGKAVRIAAAAAIDALLPAPFERTAVNGFGFVQIVRPRPRASLIEIVRTDAGAARALLRRAERSGIVGASVLTAHPRVIAALRPEWIDALARSLGGAVILRPDAALAISAGYASKA